MEPISKFAEKYYIAMASSVVDPVNSVTLEVSLMKPFPNEVVILLQDTVFGVTVPVDEVQMLVQEEDSEEIDNHDAVRQITMGERTTDDLEAEGTILVNVRCLI